MPQNFFYARQPHAHDIAITGAMNGYPPPMAPPGPVWSAAKAEDGREYYFNKVTQETTWTKPDELKDELEVRIRLVCAPIQLHANSV
jgi:hypothetical protein